MSAGTKIGSCGETWKGTAAVLWSHFLCNTSAAKPKFVIHSCSLVFAGVFLLETKFSLQISWTPPIPSPRSCLVTKILAKFSHWTCFWSHYTLQHLHPSVLLSKFIYTSSSSLSLTSLVDYLKDPPPKPLYPLYFILDSFFKREYMQLLFSSDTCPELSTVDEHYTARPTGTSPLL